jgi:predicted amidohydrolase YtcJ
MAGITRDTPDPPGGIIERDDQGKPSGALRGPPAKALAEAVIPPYTEDQVLDALRYFQGFANALGITTVCAARVFPASTDLRAYHYFDASGEMTMRVRGAVLVNPEDDLSVANHLVALRNQEAGGHFEIVAGKFFIESFTRNGAYAAFLEYDTGTIETGKKADLIVLDKNILEIPVKEIHSASVLLTFFEGREVFRSGSYQE